MCLRINKEVNPLMPPPSLKVHQMSSDNTRRSDTNRPKHNSHKGCTWGKSSSLFKVEESSSSGLLLLFPLRYCVCRLGDKDISADRLLLESRGTINEVEVS